MKDFELHFKSSLTFVLNKNSFKIYFYLKFCFEHAG